MNFLDNPIKKKKKKERKKRKSKGKHFLNYNVLYTQNVAITRK